jgi:aminopeptidase N
MTPSEAIGLSDYGQYYNKTALGLDLLRDVIIGPERFDYAFHEYIKNWAMKHPLPYDFFRAMNDAAGEDLNWFFKPWFFTTWKLDQSIDGVTYDNNDPANGALITISNQEKMAMPIELKITQTNGKTELLSLPVNVFQRNGVWKFKYPSTSAIKSIIVDPEHKLPDVNLSNNVYKAE